MKFIYIHSIKVIIISALFFAFEITNPFFLQVAGEGLNKQSKKLFSFGLIADVQYADIDKIGKRDYRGSLNKLKYGVDEFNRHNLSFVVNLGDMIDQDYISFDKPLNIINELKAPVYHVVGNHDFSVDDQFKKEVRKRLNNKRGYLEFRKGNFEFIVLDGTDLSTFATKEGSSQFKIASEYYEKIKDTGANNAYTWNGGIGKKQFKWLKEKLKKANKSGRRVILFCHWPLLPENGTQLWNNKEVLRLIDNYDCVVAWIAGHHHAGGYENKGGIHYLTLKGMVEAVSETSFGIVDVYPHKLIIRGYGDQENLTLNFPQN